MEKDDYVDNEKSSSTSFVDITSVVEACASSLTVKDPFLCNEETFNLHDSMAALELMDRKLDCCEIPRSVYDTNKKDSDANKDEETEFVPPRPAPASLSELPWEDLTLRDAKHIVLEVLARLESMMNGASVSESTFTCLYAHESVLKEIYVQFQQPLTNQITEKMAALLSPASTLSSSGSAGPTLAQRAVYASVIGLVAISHMVQNIAFNADIYEEEDFSINTHGLMDFFGEDGDLAETEGVLHRTVQLLLKNQENSSKDDSRIALLVLEFQRAFLRVCISMAKLSSTTVTDVAEETKMIINSGVRSLEQLQAMLKNEKEDEHKGSLLRKVFDLYVNRPLVGNAPIRKVVFRTPNESIPILSKILSEVDWAVCELLLKGTTLSRIRRMLNRVSKSSVNILSRSLIVLNLYFDDRLLGQHLLVGLIAKDMQQWGGVPSDLTDGTFGRPFMGRMAKPTYDTLKFLVLNRNRQCAYMEAVMLKEWSNLQNEAKVVDMRHRQEYPDGLLGENPLPPFFTQYAFLLTVWLMEHYVGLGIELELFYGQHELSIAYWYRDFLLSSLLNTLTKMRGTKMADRVAKAHAGAQGPSSIKKGKKKGAQKKKQPPASSLVTPEDSEDDLEFLWIQVKRNMCRGIIRFMAALNQAGALTVEKYTHTSHERRFEKRFEAFRAVTQPPSLTYDDFQQGSDFSSVSQKDLLKSVTESFKSGKSDVDKLIKQMNSVEASFSPIQESELRNLVKVCVGNSVFAQKLMQTNEGACGKVEFDLETHKQFCAIKIK